MSLHLYTAPHQPATRYRVAVGNGYRWVRRSPRSLVLTDCCERRRRAGRDYGCEHPERCPSEARP